ncbi:hypothetical protein [Cellulomonas shaoxiangyii]|uniref:hypothetical protein n=1 Tax=Cellulomonas shaoxiangyii TaxID=2566013 RepID=UPI00140A9036|nr:hypothetical protein [Cellulomonas shaoxiangyii]
MIRLLQLALLTALALVLTVIAAPDLGRTGWVVVPALLVLAVALAWLVWGPLDETEMKR